MTIDIMTLTVTYHIIKLFSKQAHLLDWQGVLALHEQDKKKKQQKQQALLKYF